MNIILSLFFVYITYIVEAIELDFSAIHIYVFSPIEVPYHSRRAQVFRDQIMEEIVKTKAKGKPTIDFVTNRENKAAELLFDSVIMEDKNVISNKHWILFCTEETRFNLTLMLKFLNLNDYNDDYFMGYTLKDTDNTIIHHYDNPGLVLYPDIDAAFVLSIGLVKKLIPLIEENTTDMDFRIDPKYEFAKFVQASLNVKMEHIDGFCASKFKPHCFTWITEHGHSPKCTGLPITEDDVIIAVKTCSAHFDSRIPIIKSLWSGSLPNVLYFADKENENIPTINVNVENSERGHCLKLVKILQHIADNENYNKRKFLIIVDDDTLVSIPRLYNLLSCYESEITLGERYAYMSKSGAGYKYLTGGSGMVLSMSVVKALIPIANCQPSDPDDMFLGMWLKTLGVPVVHSPLFHQARPMDYAADLLVHQEPISFHKFWNCNPDEVYNKYLSGKYNSYQTARDEL